MVSTLEQIQQSVERVIDEGNKLVSTEKIHVEGQVLFLSFMKNPLLAHLQYNVLTAALAGNLFHHKATAKQIQAALVYAEVLEHIYQHLLISPREVTTLRRDKALYRRLLFAKGYHFSSKEATNEVEVALMVMDKREKESPGYLVETRDKAALANEEKIYRSILVERNETVDEEVTDSRTKTVREMTGTSNTPRLFILRLRRFLLAINSLTKALGHAVRGLEKLDKITTPVVPYVTWIFFIPRLFTNLFLMGKHVLRHRWMDKEEEDLGWRVRLNAQAQRRWFEIANDLVWFGGGLVTCFALTGALAPAGVFLGFALQVYDLVLAIIRAQMEFKKCRNLEKDYNDLLQQKMPGTADYVEIETYLVHLNKQIAYEEKKLYLSLGNNIAMVIAVTLMLPLLLVSPWFAVAGGLLAVTNSIVCYILMRHIEKNKPKNDLPTYSKCVTHQFFKPEPKDPPKSYEGPLINVSQPASV